ncbi:MAG: Ig-like protein, partial [Thermodesulfobacteriota bacterium]|nr:Ig-like protein [Thermodesulfobacteriota bacterium]
MRIDINPVADAPTLSVVNGRSQIFTTSWETVGNSSTTSEAVNQTSLEGWTLV